MSVDPQPIDEKMLAEYVALMLRLRIIDVHLGQRYFRMPFLKAQRYVGEAKARGMIPEGDPTLLYIEA